MSTSQSSLSALLASNGSMQGSSPTAPPAPSMDSLSPSSEQSETGKMDMLMQIREELILLGEQFPEMQPYIERALNELQSGEQLSQLSGENPEGTSPSPSPSTPTPDPTQGQQPMY